MSYKQIEFSVASVCAKSSFTLYWILHTSHKICFCRQSHCCEL